MAGDVNTSFKKDSPPLRGVGIVMSWVLINVTALPLAASKAH